MLGCRQTLKGDFTLSEQTLHEKTLTLLRTRPPELKLMYISEKTGLTLYWLQSFLKNTNKTKDPGVNKIQTLYEFLKPNTLKY